MLAVPVSGPVVRALRSVQLADQRVRLRDIDCDHVQLNENGKLIDVFTEHFVELQLARHHVRVHDDVRSMDMDSVRVRVRDVDRRRARVTDQESVMDVLTEIVKVSDVVHSSLRAVLGALSWGAHSEEVSFNETKRERVQFGDVCAEPEPVITEPEEEDEEDEVFEKDDERVLFEELEDEEPAYTDCERVTLEPEEADFGRRRQAGRRVHRLGGASVRRAVRPGGRVRAAVSVPQQDPSGAPLVASQSHRYQLAGGRQAGAPAQLEAAAAPSPERLSLRQMIPSGRRS
ncbi:hypothetical protein FJT64_014140 [Amphibalanus amphitrite]|uniref:Uncharacterized protein n=1 Tax=Amphibalanus amphitrite TaxID=1232801 RepID=A0A6A4UXY2_AMPAM|nr:hypothetical protein FJT64_014140 [Amphibalanus amphitrite]